MNKKFLVLTFLITLLVISACAPVEQPKKDKGKGLSELTVVEDVPYGDNAFESFDVYYDENNVDAPVIFIVHGGPFGDGDKRKVRSRIPIYADLGFTIVLPNYRYFKAPAEDKPEVSTTHDLACAIATFRESASEYGADPETIILHGHSGGAVRSSFIYFRQEHDWLEGCDIGDVAPIEIDGLVAESVMSPGFFIPEGYEAEIEDYIIVGPQELLDEIYATQSVTVEPNGSLTPNPAEFVDDGAVNYIDPADPHSLILYGTEDGKWETTLLYQQFIDQLEANNVVTHIHVEPGAKHAMHIERLPHLTEKVQTYVLSVANGEEFPFFNETYPAP